MAIGESQRVMYERGKGGRQPAPSQWARLTGETGGDVRPVKAPQASQARPAPHIVGSLFARAKPAREKCLPCQREVPSVSEAEGFLAVCGCNGQSGKARRNPPGR